MVPRISIVVGTRDEPELLDHAIAAQLRSGATSVWIMDNGPADDAAARTAHLTANPQIRLLSRLEAARHGKRPEVLMRFDGPLFNEMMREDAPDWVMFCDSDEFPVLRRGISLGDLVRSAESHDILDIDRYNVAQGPGSINPTILAEESVLRRLPLIVSGKTLNPAGLTQDSKERWILHRPETKALVRVAAAVGFGQSGHNALPRNGRVLRRHQAADMLLVHVPFTDYIRFERKVRNIENFFGEFDTLSPKWGWHWRYWLQLYRAGELPEEFARQSFDSVALAIMRERGELSTADELLARPEKLTQCNINARNENSSSHGE